MNAATATTIEVLGWMLAHSLWLFLIPAVLLGILLLLIPATWARVRYTAALLALLVIAALPLAMLVFGVGHTIDDEVAKADQSLGGYLSSSDVGVERSSDDVALQRKPSQVDRSPRLLVDPAERIHRREDSRRRDLPRGAALRNAVVATPDAMDRSPSNEQPTKPIPDFSNGPANQEQREVSKVSSSKLVSRIRPWLPWAVGLWFVGVLVMSLRLISGWRSMMRMRTTGCSEVPDRVHSMFRQLTSRLKVTAAVNVAQSTLARVPSVVGHFQPVVLLPVSTLTGLSEPQLRAILAHELAHVKRYDYLVNMLQTAIETLLFYHPVVWWVSHVVRVEREYCCDDLALSLECHAVELAQALVAVDAARVSDPSILASAADGGNLLRRIRRLAGGTRQDRIVYRSWMAGLLAISLLTALGVAASMPADDGGDDPSLRPTPPSVQGELTPQQHSKEAKTPVGSRRPSSQRSNDRADDGRAEDGLVSDGLAEADVTDADAASSTGQTATTHEIPNGRCDLGDGFFLNLMAISDYARQLQPSGDDLDASSVWDANGTPTTAPFAGIRGSVPALNSVQVARKFYLGGRLPIGSKVNLRVPGKLIDTADTAQDSTDVGMLVEASCVAVLPNDQASVSLAAELLMPLWQTVATFDFAGGVHHGIRVERDRKADDFTNFTISGDFQVPARQDLIRFVAFDRKHNKLEPERESLSFSSDPIPMLKIKFDNRKGRPYFLTVQTRQPWVVKFDQVPTQAGRPTKVRTSIEGRDAKRSSLAGSKPLKAEIPGVGSLKLVGLRAYGDEGSAWAADGAPLRWLESHLLSTRTTSQPSERERHVEAVLEFEAARPNVGVGQLRIRPDDGHGTLTSRRTGGDGDTPLRIVMSQTLTILRDRETDDLTCELDAGPWKPRAAVEMIDAPSDYHSEERFRWHPQPELTNVAFPLEREMNDGPRWFMIVLDDDAPQSARLTARMSNGDRIVSERVSAASGRRMMARFDLPRGVRPKSIHVETRTQYSFVFRNISMVSNLGSRPFVDWPSTPSPAFKTMPAARVFRRADGTRFADDATHQQVVLQALREVERRGGLLRFDASAPTPRGERLPYLTEVRWEAVRPDELTYLRPLAGLQRLKLNSKHLTDESLRSIEHLSTLQQLEVSRAGKITTACLQSIGKLTQLQQLKIVSPVGHDHEAYNASDFKQLGDLTEIREWEPYDWRMDDAGIAWLNNASKLELVYGWGPRVTDVGFAALADKPNLGVIFLGPTQITDASFKLLEQHPKLYWLDCPSSELTDAAIESVITISNLRDLNLSGSRVTDAGIRKLIAAVDELPRLETVVLADTAVSAAVADELRRAKPGLRVVGIAQPESTETAELLDKESGNEKLDSAPPAVVAAPTSVPWPIQQRKSFSKYPPSGTGLRVQLDDRRWVELNSLSTPGSDPIVWKPNGQLIDPPNDFDPRSLVPQPDESGSMPKVARGAAVQVVAPKETAISISTGGLGGYANNAFPIDEEFVQFPVQVAMTSLSYNHSHVSVSVTREDWDVISPQGLDDLIVLSSADAKRIVVAGLAVREFAWRADVQDESGDLQTISPFVTGVEMDSSFVPDELHDELAKLSKTYQAVVFATPRDQPLPKLLEIRRSRYDVVRFDNLAVFPGPLSAVHTSVNGTPVSEDQRWALREQAEVEEKLPVQNTENTMEPILLKGKVVDAESGPVEKCWVGMFVEPTTGERASAFDEGEIYVGEAMTDANGIFSMIVPRDHFVFNGSFWAIQPGGASGSLRLNCTWSHLQENLTLQIDNEVATIKVVDPDGNALAKAAVAPEAFRKSRRATHRVPAKVREKLTVRTDDQGIVKLHGWSAASIRGVAVTAQGFGIQYLSDRLASEWVKDGQALQLQLRSTASLRGHIEGFDRRRDRGLMLRVTTEVHGGRRPPLYGRSILSVADDGTFSVPEIVAGRVAFASSLPADSQTKIQFRYVPELKPGEVRLIAENPRLVPAVTVRQRIVKQDTGEGIPDLKLRVLWGDAVEGRGSWNSSKETRTDEQGWWTARVLPGTINVRIRSIPEGYRGTAWFDGRNGRLGVEHMIPVTDNEVTLPAERYLPSKELTGRLLLPDGNPAVNWSIYGHPISWDDVGVGGVHTDEQGRFTWSYPEGYPPRFIHASNREWLTEHHFEDDDAYPAIVSEDPLILQIPASETGDPAQP